MANTFDDVSNFVFGAFDRISQGVSTYFDGAIAYNEAEARLAQSKLDKQSYQSLSGLETGSTASAWGNIDPVGINLGSTQGMLVVAGVGLAIFAVLKAK